MTKSSFFLIWRKLIIARQGNFDRCVFGVLNIDGNFQRTRGTATGVHIGEHRLQRWPELRRRARAFNPSADRGKHGYLLLGFVYVGEAFAVKGRFCLTGNNEHT